MVGSLVWKRIYERIDVVRRCSARFGYHPYPIEIIRNDTGTQVLLRFSVTWSFTEVIARGLGITEQEEVRQSSLVAYEDDSASAMTKTVGLPGRK